MGKGEERKKGRGEKYRLVLYVSLGVILLWKMG